MIELLKKQFLKSQCLALLVLTCLMVISWRQNGEILFTTLFKIVVILQVCVFFGMFISWLNLRAKNIGN